MYISIKSLHYHKSISPIDEQMTNDTSTIETIHDFMMVLNNVW